MKYPSVSLLLSGIIRAFEWLVVFGAMANGMPTPYLALGLGFISSALLVLSVAYPFQPRVSLWIGSAGALLSWVTTGPNAWMAIRMIHAGPVAPGVYLFLLPLLFLSWATIWLIWAHTTKWASQDSNNVQTSQLEP